MSYKYPLLFKSSRKPRLKNMSLEEWEEVLLDYRVRRTLIGFIFWAIF